MKKTRYLALYGLMATLCGAALTSLHAQGCDPDTKTKPTTQKSDLEPYLKESLDDLVAQIKSDATSEIIKHRAMMRVAARYPEKAPDALVPFVYQGVNEYTGELLFRLGRPNSKTAELVANIRQGRNKWALEHIVVFAKALAWPGNDAAIPTLQQMIDEKWDTANEARLCIARIQDEDGPQAMLALPSYASGQGDNYRSSVAYAKRVGQLLRTLAQPKTNESLLKDGDPTKALSLWDQEGIYALAWRGNTPLADAYLKAKNPYTRFHIAAARTRDERCLKAIRVLFEKEAAAFLEAKPAARSVDGFRWMCIAGVEAANEDTAPTLVKLLAAVEEMRRTAEADLKARIDRGDLIKKLTNTDPAGSLRDIILRGLCGNPNPKTKEILTPYQDEVKGDWSYLAGLALLRAGNPQGMQCLLNRWSYSPDDKVGEAFLIYSGVDLLSNTMRGADGGLAKAKTWYAQSKDGQPLRDRIARVNQEGLSQSLVEQLMLWP